MTALKAKHSRPNNALRTAFREAVLSGDVDAMRSLAAQGVSVETGMDITVSYADGTTSVVHSWPLRVAASRWDVPMIEALLELGAITTKRLGRKCNSNLLEVAAMGRPEGGTAEAFERTARLLHGVGYSANECDDRDYSYTIFEHCVVNQAPPHVLKTLLSVGADPLWGDSEGVNALYHAVHKGRLDALHVLVEAGTDLTGEMPRGNLLNEAVVAAAMHSGFDDDGVAVEPEVVLAQLREIVTFLRAQGLPMICGNDHWQASVTHTAVDNDDDKVDVLKTVLALGGPVDYSLRDGKTPLLDAAWRANPGCVATLLEHGADIHHAAENGDTVLHKALGKPRHGDDWEPAEATLNVLLSHGARVDAANADGDLPLHIAAQGGLVRAVPLLVDRGAAVEARNASDLTPVMIAALHVHGATMEALLDRGACAEVTTNDGESLLHLLCAHEAEERSDFAVGVKACLRHDIDIDSQDRFGRTALMHAIQNGTPYQVATLLELGATPSVADCNGIDAMGVLASSRITPEKRRDMESVLHAWRARHAMGAMLHSLGHDVRTARFIGAS